MSSRYIRTEIKHIEADLAKYGGKTDAGSVLWQKILEARLEELKQRLAEVER